MAIVDLEHLSGEDLDRVAIAYEVTIIGTRSESALMQLVRLGCEESAAELARRARLEADA